jgi:hypothetical protein
MPVRGDWWRVSANSSEAPRMYFHTASYGIPLRGKALREGMTPKSSHLFF